VSEAETALIKHAAEAASNAAVIARECADILDDYAKCLLDPALEGRARELRGMFHEKHGAIAEAVHTSDEWRLRR